MATIDPEKIGHLLHQTARVWRQKLDERLRPLGLSQAKWRTIANLSDGQLTQCELAGRLGIEEPTLARSLVSLENSGWIKRAHAAHDRRCKTVRLQRKSSTLLQRIEETARDLRHEIIETIPAADLQTCMRVLADIRNKAAAVPADGANGQAKAKKRALAK